MLFAVWRWGGAFTLGEESGYFLGYCRLASEEEAKKVFPEGIFGGFRVRKVEVSTPEALLKIAKKRGPV